MVRIEDERGTLFYVSSHRWPEWQGRSRDDQMRLTFAVVGKDHSIIKEPDDLEAFFEKLLVKKNRKGLFDFFKVSHGDDVKFIPRHVMKEFANSHEQDISQYAVVQLAGDSLIKCRYDMAQMLKDYFKEVNQKHADDK